MTKDYSNYCNYSQHVKVKDSFRFIHKIIFVINDKLILVGILSGQNFNEDASKFEHRVYILTIDDDKISIESFINPEAINFYKLRIDKESDLKILDNLKNNSVSNT